MYFSLRFSSSLFPTLTFLIQFSCLTVFIHLNGLIYHLSLCLSSFVSVPSVHVSLMYFDNGTLNILYNLKYALPDIMSPKGLNIFPMIFTKMFTNFFWLNTFSIPRTNQLSGRLIPRSIVINQKLIFGHFSNLHFDS